MTSTDTSVAHAAGDISASTRGWRCLAMLIGPLLVFVGMMAAPLPQAGDQFEPTALTWWGLSRSGFCTPRCWSRS